MDILIKISQNRKNSTDKNKEAIAKISKEDKEQTIKRRVLAFKENYAKLSEEEKQRRRDNTRKALNRPEVRKKLSECSKGQYIWNNGVVEIKCRECPGSYFVRGLLPEHKKRCGVNQNKIRYTDGYHNILLDPDVTPPEGFYKGLTIRNPNKNLQGPKGKTLYNNGVVAKFFSKSDIIPEG